MKNKFQFMLLALALFGLAACGSEAPEGEKVEAGEAIETTDENAASGTTYMVNTEESQIDWVGSEAIGGEHTGYINLKEGKLMVEDGNITGGSFVIDMTTITDTDLAPEDGKAKLEGHLKSDDFFNVSEHPTSTFEIVSVEAVESDTSGVSHRITGNLTMRGITKSVTIPANVSMADGKLMASTPQFTIDRTKWDVMFRASMTNTAKEKMINDLIGLKINLQAAPEGEMTEKMDS